MKDLNLLMWLAQLGLSVAAPLAGFVLLAVWLHSSCGWGLWVIFVGVFLGLAAAISAFRKTLRTLSGMSKDKKEPPPISFNEHN